MTFLCLQKRLFPAKTIYYLMSIVSNIYAGNIVTQRSAEELQVITFIKSN